MAMTHTLIHDEKALPTLQEQCTDALLPVKDALEVLSGNWKLLILIALSTGVKRFRQLAREVPGITDKMLSKELKDLEANHLVTRTVYDSFPPTVEYQLTLHAHSLGRVIAELRDWGQLHRKKVMGA